MIGEDDRVKVMDFGIAKLPSLSLPTVGTVLGSPHYMSPEQISGQSVDIRSDIFSVGAVFYEALTGERPFTAETTSALIYKILQVDPIPPRVLNLNVPEAVGAIIKKALAKNPADRFQTPTEMLTALRAFSQSRLAFPGGTSFPAIGAAVGEELGMNREAKPPRAPEDDRTNSRQPSPAPVAVKTRHSGDSRRFVKTVAISALVMMLALAGAAALRRQYSPQRDLQQPAPPGTPAATSVAASGSPRANGQLVVSVEALLDQAKNLWETEPGSAQKLLEQAVALDPHHFEATFQLARFLTFKKDFPAAIQQYQNALRINNQVPEVFFNLGYIYVQQGTLDQAIVNYEASQALSPPYLDEVLTNLAVCHWKKNNAAQARVLLKQARDFNPNNEPARTYLNTLEKSAAPQK